jgi:hypothetical protein
MKGFTSDPYFVVGQISVLSVLLFFIYILHIDVTSFQFHTNTYWCNNNNIQRRCRQHHGHQSSSLWFVSEQKQAFFVYPLLHLVPNTLEFTTTDTTFIPILLGQRNVTISVTDTTTTVTPTISQKFVPQQQQQHSSKQRVARRMNHSFKYLHRHGFDELVMRHHNCNDITPSQNNNTTTTTSTTTLEDPATFLRNVGRYTSDQIQSMNASFPMLLQLSVRQQLYPKLQFLHRTLLLEQQVPAPTEQHNNEQKFRGTTATTVTTTAAEDEDESTRVVSSLYHDQQMVIQNLFSYLPSYYYGIRLERCIAPRHAFLVWTRVLPYGRQLFQPIVVSDQTHPKSGSDENHTTEHTNDNSNVSITCKFQEFLYACRTTKSFAALCQQWAQNEAITNDASFMDRPLSNKPAPRMATYTAKDIEAFDVIFSRCLLSICRNDLVQSNNTWALD